MCQKKKRHTFWNKSSRGYIRNSAQYTQQGRRHPWTQKSPVRLPLLANLNTTTTTTPEQDLAIVWETHCATTRRETKSSRSSRPFGQHGDIMAQVVEQSRISRVAAAAWNNMLQIPNPPTTSTCIQSNFWHGTSGTPTSRKKSIGQYV
jgi:hypothetical protein